MGDLKKEKETNKEAFVGVLVINGAQNKQTIRQMSALILTVYKQICRMKIHIAYSGN